MARADLIVELVKYAVSGNKGMIKRLRKLSSPKNGKSSTPFWQIAFRMNSKSVLWKKIKARCQMGAPRRL